MTTTNAVKIIKSAYNDAGVAAMRKVGATWSAHSKVWSLTSDQYDAIYALVEASRTRSNKKDTALASWYDSDATIVLDAPEHVVTLHDYDAGDDDGNVAGQAVGTRVTRS